MSYAIKLNTAQRYGQNLSLEIRGSLMAYIATNYGFRYIDETQHLNGNMVIFNSHVLVGAIKNLREDSYAVHYCEGSWRKNWWPRRKIIMDKIITAIRHLFGYHRKYNEGNTAIRIKN